MKNQQNFSRDIILILASILLGISASFLDINVINTTAQTVSELFIKFLQLMSAPIIFLAITTNFLNLGAQQHLRFYGKRVVFYTIITTLAAATVAYILYQIIDPSSTILLSTNMSAKVHNSTYLAEITKIFPNNIVNAFAENNVLGVALIAVIMGVAMMQLPKDQQDVLHPVFSGLFQTFINVARFIITVLPLGIWSFTVLFCQAIINQTISLGGLGKYALIIIAANLIQGFIILPLFLKYKKLAPLKLVKSVYPALTTAFFSKSSSVALPISIDCMIENHGTREDLTKFSLPICTIINMNGCAAFIYTTVIFVASQSGIAFNTFDYILWIFIATLVAIGNASVPMGCYFLSSAILVGMGVPLYIMGLILPLYTFIDMIETCLNVWSDCCVTDIVNHDSDEVALV